MLFAGLEVRTVKNCDRGLENAVGGCRPRAAFSSSRSQYFTTRSNPKPANITFIFFLGIHLLSRGFVYATLSLNSVTRRLQTICNLMKEQASISDKSDTRQRKMY